MSIKGVAQDALSKQSSKNAAKSDTAQVQNFLQKYKSHLINALPKHVNADKMIRVILTEFSKNPELYKCTTSSTFGAIIQSSQYGLLPGVLGQSYLIPYNNKRKRVKECQFQIGYKGLIDLARRSGTIISIMANEVKKGDRFVFEYGTNERIEHKPADSGRGEITHFYAYAKLKDGGFQFVVMTVDQVNAIKNLAKTQNIWESHFPEMGKKTVIKRLSKLLPMSVDYASAVDLDDKSVMGDEQAIDLPSGVALDNDNVEDTESEDVDVDDSNEKLGAIVIELNKLNTVKDISKFLDSKSAEISWLTEDQKNKLYDIVERRRTAIKKHKKKNKEGNPA